MYHKMHSRNIHDFHKNDIWFLLIILLYNKKKCNFKYYFIPFSFSSSYENNATQLLAQLHRHRTKSYRISNQRKIILIFLGP